MENKFIAYFDFLGYKSFIMNNSTEEVKRRLGHIFRDTENAIGKGKLIEAPYGYIADINKSKINCLNISDTIIFWTNDDSLDSFNEILEVAFRFNRSFTCFHFPVRGAIVHGDMGVVGYYKDLNEGGTYNLNTLYGKGLIKAHEKGENLNLASCVIDDSVIEKIREFGEPNDIIGNKAMRYNVPYKKPLDLAPEYLLKFYVNDSINKEAFANLSKGIKGAFEGDNKEMTQRANEMLENTIQFLKALVRED